jgi:hypothetical protein
MATVVSIDEVLAKLPDGQPIPLSNNAHRAVIMPEYDPSFLKPSLKLIEKSHLTEVPLIIISAPGAVGKTALASYISACKECYLWDLSNLKLGDNSFVGTIAQCFDPGKLAGILESLKNGNMCFVIDAFDEAEILSGWHRVEDFLTELWNYVKESPNFTLVLLARSETAQLMALYLDDVELEMQPYIMLEIDYFQYEESKNFISLQVQRIAKEKNQEEIAKRHAQHIGPFNEAVDSVFSSIYEAFSVKAESAWESKVLRSFLGYAPVLQAIATYVSSFSNYQEVQKRIGEGVLSLEGAEIASSILYDLLKREQSKVVAALEKKGISQAASWTEWDQIYTPQEQLYRIMFYVLKDPNATGLEIDSLKLPEWLVDHYLQCLNSFLPNHPFLKNYSFTGPAFRDFTLANLLKSSEINFQSEARSYME